MTLLPYIDYEWQVFIFTVKTFQNKQVWIYFLNIILSSISMEFAFLTEYMIYPLNQTPSFSVCSQYKSIYNQDK